MRRLLAGLAGGIALAAGSASAAITLVGARAASFGGSPVSSIAANLPAGVAAGDVLVAQVAVRGAGNSITPDQPGWTLIATQVAGTSLRQSAYWRLAGGTEPASYDFSFSVSERAEAGIVAYRGVDRAQPVHLFSTRAATSGSAVQANGLTTTLSDARILALFSVASTGSFTAPAGMSDLYDATTSAGTNGVTIAAADLSQTVNGATGNKTATASVSAANVGQLVALKPAALARADYHFDECAYTGAGNEVIDSFGGLHATARNGFTTGTPGQVQRFGNFDSYARWVQTTIPLARDWSVSTWFRMPFSSPAGTSQYHILASVAGGGDLLYVDRASGGGAYRWGVYTTSGTTDGSFRFSTLADGWHHMAVVGQGANTRLYIDGSLRDTVARKAGGTLAYLGTSFDGVNTATAQGFRAPLDEFMVWDHVLNAAEIAAIYANQQAGNNFDGTPRAGACGGVASFAIGVGAGSASTCAPYTITITARDAGGATLTGYTGTVSLGTSTGRGDWSAVAAAGTLANGTADDGAASYTFAAADNGVASLALRHAIAGSVTVSAVDGALPASASTSAPIAFADNALVLSVDESAAFAAANPAGALVAGRPHRMKAELWTKSGSLCSRLDFTKAGVASRLWVSPDAAHVAGATLPRAATAVDATAACVAPAGPLGTAVPGATTLNLNFSAGAATFYLCPSDVGRYVLNGRIVDAALPSVQDGASPTLTARPFALTVSGLRAGLLDNPGGAAPGEPVFTAAGKDFAAVLGAYAWSPAADQRDGAGAVVADGRGDGHADAAASFAQASAGGLLARFAATARLGASLNTPAAGSAGQLMLGGASADVPMAAGVAAPANLYYTEVGSFHLVGAAPGGAAVAGYLGGAGVDLAPLVFDAAGARNDVLGRFIPAEFRVSGATLTNRSDLSAADRAACGGSVFTYLGEPFHVQFTLSAHAAHAGNPVTANYEGAFAALTPLFARLDLGLSNGATSYTASLTASCPVGTCGTWAAGQASAQAELRLARTVDNACTAAEKPSGPFDAVVVGLSPVDADGVAMQTPFDFDRDGDAVPDGRQIAATILRFGRLRLGAAYGTQTRDLAVPMEAQYWNGTGFVTHTLDNCTRLAAGNVRLQGYNPPALSASVPQANVSFASTYLSGGRAGLRLGRPLPEARGSLRLCLDLDAGAAGDLACQAGVPANMAFLQNYSACGVYARDPATSAAFGLYRPPESFIHFRENF